MPSPSWENLDDFLQEGGAGGFAISGVIALQGGGTRTVLGIYDDPYLNAQLGEYELDTTAPRFGGKATDMAGVHRFDTITIAGVGTMDVIGEPQPDGTGWATVPLAKPSV